MDADTSLSFLQRQDISPPFSTLTRVADSGYLMCEREKFNLQN